MKQLAQLITDHLFGRNRATPISTNEDTSTMNAKTKFLHLRRPSVTVGTSTLAFERAGPFGGLTVAYSPDPLREGIFHVAVARCRPDERYVKAEGRKVAIQKLLDGDSATIECVAATRDEDVLTKIAELVYETNASSYRRNLRAQVNIIGSGRAGSVA